MAQTRARKAAWRTAIAGGAVNTLLVLIKAVGGWFSGSQALVADAVHSLVDLVTDIITFFAVRVGRTDADATHPYGHGKFETFGTLLLSVFLALAAFGLGAHMVQHIWAGKTVITIGSMALWAAAASVVLNEGLFRYCLYEGKKVHSKPIIANAWHHRADGLSSVAVLLGLGAEYLGFIYGDELATAVVIIFLLKVAYGLGREAFDELVEAAIAPDAQEKLVGAVLTTQGVLNCHHFRARAIGVHIVVDVHVDVDPLISVSEGHHIAELVEHNLRLTNMFVTDVTVHVDPAHHHHAPTKAAKAPTREVLEAYIHQKIAAICPAARLEGVTLHFIKDEATADLVFSAFPEEEGSGKKRALQTALEEPEGPFKGVQFFIKL